MKNEIENKAAYQRAKKRVAAKLGFKTHLFVYISVCILLFLINVSTSTDVLWFRYPLMGWGIGVLIHGLKVYVFSGKSGITEEMIQKEMEKEG